MTIQYDTKKLQSSTPRRKVSISSSVTSHENRMLQQRPLTSIGRNINSGGKQTVIETTKPVKLTRFNLHTPEKVTNGFKRPNTVAMIKSNDGNRRNVMNNSSTSFVSLFDHQYRPQELAFLRGGELRFNTYTTNDLNMTRAQILSRQRLAKLTDAELKQYLRRTIRASNLSARMKRAKSTDFGDMGEDSEVQSRLQLDPEKKKLVRNRYKRAFRLITNVIKLTYLQKLTQEKLRHKYNFEKGFQFSMSDENLFDKEYFVRPKEAMIPDDIKRLLQIPPNERTDEQLTRLIKFLDLFVPEFNQYPKAMQRMLLASAIYQEFEPGRVILRQGHVPENFYFILNGNGLLIEASPVQKNDLHLLDTRQRRGSESDELKFTIKSVLKKGDHFGDEAIIRNVRQPFSVYATGTGNIILLSVTKEMFFQIQQQNKESTDHLGFMRERVDILRVIEYPFDELEQIHKFKRRAYFSIYFRPGRVICDTSSHDDWFYVVKSGSCDVLKRVKFDRRAYDIYKDSMTSDRTKRLDKYIHVNDLTKSKYMEPQSARETCSTGLLFNDPAKIQSEKMERVFNKFEFSNEESFLKIKSLKEGEVFGLHETIVDKKNVSLEPVILVSEGVECILVNKRLFVQLLNIQTLNKLRFMITPYPSEESVVKKHFNNFLWSDFKNRSFSSAMNQMRKEQDLKSSSMFQIL